ncbi:cytochrome c oxidase assembly protein [Tessaracoccus rhinocerotis]|uniref:Cytochrome c oxidase assembly protein n=1 Tax=Tessaracoccus rhinocerotis TaxID=1689449 RepID=A0A553JWU0_9ACTN|nr:cytochrome c oxidase assembly protein [Tessaracoccus rhinocerotis]TRY16918.1 cytochrome c oxidase assembly protein [Tessaracoccus rhinocerotis]
MTATTATRATTPTSRVPGALVALVAVGLLLAVPVVTTAVLGAAPYEQIVRVFPGPFVAITATVLRAMADGAALVSVGAIVVLLFLRDATSKQAQDLGSSFELRVLQRASGLWMLAVAGLMLFDPLDTSGVDLAQVLMPGALAYVQTAAYAPLSVFVQFFGATVVTLGAHFARRWTGLLFPLLAATWAVLAPVVVGHVLVGPDHDLGGDAMVIQLFATQSLFGVLAVLALRAWSGREITPGIRRRTALLGAVAVPVIVVTDVILAVFLLAGSGLFSSLSGWFIVARWVCLAVLVVTGALSTGGVLGRDADAPAPSQARVRVALSVAALAIAGWVGVTVAHLRVPTPQYFEPTSIAQTFLGFDVDAAPTALVLFGQWRVNLLLLAIAVAAMVAYFVALRAARRRGVEWPLGRTIAWSLGWALVVFATSSGFGRYSAPHFGIHMMVHMSLSMMAPVLLVLGGFLTLLLRASKADSGAQHNLHDWVSWAMGWRVVRFLYNPLIVFVSFIGSYYLLYLTDLFGTMVRYHWAHQLMNVHFLLVGYLYYGLIIGVDRAPKPLPHLGRLGLIMAAMPFHAFFGVILMGSQSIIAATFYTYLDQPWMDLPAAQELGGGVAWAGGEIPALVVIIALGIQWAKQDRKEAARKDRHLDSGRDQEFEDYNAMLARLAQRNPQAPKAPVKEDPQP